MGCDVQACESERVSSGMLRPGAEVQRQQLAPGIERFEIFIGHAGMLQGASQVEAEVVGGAQRAIRSGAGLDGEHLLEHVLLTLLGNYIEENAKNVGLLAEDFLIGIVGQETATAVPALSRMAERTWPARSR